MREDNLLCVRKDFKPKNHQFQARSQDLSKSRKGVEDNTIESGMGFHSAGNASDGIWIEAFTQNWR